MDGDDVEMTEVEILRVPLWFFAREREEEVGRVRKG